ncbi:Ubiquitin-protein ligase [Rhynchospora pubera]|uniref:Ubiquitin-protein ligase n=1 Tax=Rhynchospora pubera TaxID=906938 RepID=A0AAV8FLV0_9POAL|nr:Ubiquitin-protein ligase [Rhynchospora pubera]
MERQRFKRDWAGLPPELVSIIGKKVTTNTEYTRFRSSKTHRFRLPYINGKHICGCSHGWLILEHDHKVSLFNPITQISIYLPSFEASPTHLNQIFLKKRQFCLVSCNPYEDGCIVVVGLKFQNTHLPTHKELRFCRIGDTHWTGLEMLHEPGKLLDFTCHKKFVYTISKKGEVSGYDTQDQSVRTIPSKVKYRESYGRYSPFRDEINLLEGDSESNEPLVLKYTLKDDKSERIKIAVYKWFDDRQNWYQVRNIGKRVIFFNEEHSINLQVEEGPERKKENELYNYVARYVGKEFAFAGINRVYFRSGMVVLQKPRTIEELPPGSGCPMWITPSLI